MEGFFTEKPKLKKWEIHTKKSENNRGTARIKAKDWLSDIKRMAESVVELQKKENTVLPMLKKRMAETDKAISNLLDAMNLLDAIRQGLFNAAAKQRMDELEAAKAALKIQIAQEEMQPTTTKDQIVFWISQFRHGDTKDIHFRRSLIDSFANAIYLCDAKPMLIYNRKDGTATVPLEAVEQALDGTKSGSDLVQQGGEEKPCAYWPWGFFFSAQSNFTQT